MKTNVIRSFIITVAVLAAIALSVVPPLAMIGYIGGFKAAAAAVQSVAPALATILWINPGIHVAPFNPFAGEGEQDAFLNFDVAAADRFMNAGLTPGDFFRFQEGIFQLAYNGNGSALALGDLVTFKVAIATVTVTAATADLLTVGGGGVGSVNEHVGRFVFVKSGTGTGQLRRILEHTDTTIRVSRFYPSLQLAAASAPDAFDTVPVNTDTVSIIGFDLLKKTAGVTENVQGVSRGAYADTKLGIFQVAGPCLAKLVGSTDAVTALGPLVPSATAGVGKGFTTAGETAAEARLSFGVGFDAYTGAAGLRHVFLTGKNVIGACGPKIR